MKTRGIFRTALLILTFGIPTAWAEVRLETRVDPQNLSVGDRFLFQVRLHASPDIVPEIPVRPAQLGPFELMDFQTKTFPSEDGHVLEANYTLIAFEAGVSTIPAITFSYAKNGRLGQTVRSPEIPVSIRSRLAQDATDIRDIKPLVRMPWGQSWLLVALMILIPGILAGLALRRRRQGLPASSSRPKEPPYETALRELETLSKNAEGPAKVYYSRLSEIFRSYLEYGLRIPALERTSYELAAELKERFDAQSCLELRAIFDVSDLAKFAKQEPDIEERLRNLERLRRFVNETKPAPIVEEPARTV